MLSPLPRRSDWASSLLIRPVVSAFPDRVVGSACASTFSRFARRSLTLRPAHSRCHQFVTRITEGFSHFVTSIAAPVASGWSGCRVGLAPTGKRHLLTAHTLSSRWLLRLKKVRFTTCYCPWLDLRRATGLFVSEVDRCYERLSMKMSLHVRRFCIINPVINTHTTVYINSIRH
jgi:hypothetical protein